jgi:hypothetical protein
MEIFRADIINGKLQPGYFTSKVEEDHWIVQGLNLSKQYGQKQYVFHDLGKEDFVSYVYTDDIDYLYNLCKNPTAQFWLLLGVVHGRENPCTDLLDTHVVKITDVLKETSESFNEEIKDAV